MGRLGPCCALCADASQHCCVKPAPHVPNRASLAALISTCGYSYQVYKARRKFTGRTVAIKVINKVGKPQKEIDSLRQELLILKTLKHPNIVEMLESIETDKDFCVVMEYALGMGPQLALICDCGRHKLVRHSCGISASCSLQCRAAEADLPA